MIKIYRSNKGLEIETKDLCNYLDIPAPSQHYWLFQSNTDGWCDMRDVQKRLEEILDEGCKRTGEWKKERYKALYNYLRDFKDSKEKALLNG